MRRTTFWRAASIAAARSRARSTAASNASVIPVGASGLRMAYEVYSQLLGRAGSRQLGKVDLGLTHNLGGAPFNSVAAVSIFGRLN